MAITATYKRAGGGWRGALKDDGRVVWVCPHVHRNRDQSTRTNGTSARSCAEAVKLALTDPAAVEKNLRWASGHHTATGPEYGRLLIWAIDAAKSVDVAPTEVRDA